MALDADVLRRIREWIGVAPPSDAELEALYVDAFDSDAMRVVLSILRERRAALVANPLSYSVSGDYSVDRASQVKALDDLIGKAEGLTEGEGGGIVSTTIQRHHGGRAGLPVHTPRVPDVEPWT